MFVTHHSLHALLLATVATLPAQAQTAPVPAPQNKPTAPPKRDGDEVVVTGGRDEVQASVDRLSFDLRKDLQVQTGTVADALRAVPGVEVDLEGKVSLRGDSGVTILIDGRPSAMMRGESRGTVLLSMPAANIERVEVITNPSAAFSPEGSAGVINLVTRRAAPGAKSQGPTQALTLRGTLGLEGRGGLGLSSSYGKGPLTLTGDLNYRRFTTDNGLTQIRERSDAAGAVATSRQDSEQDNTMSARTGRFGIDYDLNKRDRLSAELNVRDMRIDTERTDLVTGAGAYARESDIAMRNRGAGLRTSWRRALPGAGHEFTADVEGERSRLRREVWGVTTPAGGGAIYEAIRNAALRDELNVKLDYKRPLGEGRSLNIGYQAEISDTAFDFSGARGPSFDELTPVAGLTNMFDVDQRIHAWFATLGIDTGMFEIQPGVRFEQVDLTLNQVTDGVRFENDYFRVYPTLHLGYELSASQKLRGSYSRRVQRPSPQDLNPYLIYIDPLNVRRGNPGLMPEVTDSFELGWQMRKGGAFYSATAFYRRSRGGVTDVVTDLGGTFLTTRANLAAAQRAGIEGIANGKFSKTLSYNLSATLLWNEIDARIGAAWTPRSGTTWTLRGNLSWQPSANDFLQLNGFLSGDQLIAQGYRRSGGVMNLGYRRKLDERFSLLLTAQNVLDSAKFTTVIDAGAFRDRIEQRGAGRIVLLGLTYTMGQGGRRRQEPAFDFDQGGTPQ